jgi:tRNA A37 threonylcarbamoyladenosine dehydratase
MNTIDTCKECGKQLKKTKHERLSQKVCNDCRGEYMSVNKGVRQIFKEMRDNPTEPSEDEKRFDDSPVALREEEYGRVSKNSSVVSSWGMSALSEIMTETDTNKYRLTHGSATNGTRYTYKKRKAE